MLFYSMNLAETNISEPVCYIAETFYGSRVPFKTPLCYLGSTNVCETLKTFEFEGNVSVDLSTENSLSLKPSYKTTEKIVLDVKFSGKFSPELYLDEAEYDD